MRSVTRRALITNPYVRNDPAIANNGDLKGGHLNHTGPGLSRRPTGATSFRRTPYRTPNGQLQLFPGYNWTPEGQAIYENDCNLLPPASARPQADYPASRLCRDSGGRRLPRPLRLRQQPERPAHPWRRWARTMGSCPCRWTGASRSFSKAASSSPRSRHPGRVGRRQCPDLVPHRQRASRRRSSRSGARARSPSTRRSRARSIRIPAASTSRSTASRSGSPRGDGDSRDGGRSPPGRTPSASRALVRISRDFYTQIVCRTDAGDGDVVASGERHLGPGDRGSGRGTRLHDHERGQEGPGRTRWR